MYKDSVAGLEECFTHNQILSVITKNVQSMLQADLDKNDGQTSSKGEILENSYMFFISKISVKGGQIKIEKSLYEQTIIK